MVIFRIFKGNELVRNYFFKENIIVGVELFGKFQIITENDFMLTSADVFYKILKIAGAKELASFPYDIDIPEGTNTFSFRINLDGVSDFDSELKSEISSIFNDGTEVMCRVYN